jgi:hypothetical protein
MRSDDVYSLPRDLSIPVDDGSCDHLAGLLWPSVPLRSTRGSYVSLAAVKAAWLVVYFYPRTGLPHLDPPGGLARAVVLRRPAPIAIITPRSSSTKHKFLASAHRIPSINARSLTGFIFHSNS